MLNFWALECRRFLQVCVCFQLSKNCKANTSRPALCTEPSWDQKPGLAGIVGIANSCRALCTVNKHIQVQSSWKKLNIVS